MSESNEEIINLQARLLGSFLEFTKFFFKIRTGTEFVISEAISREPYQITICRFLKQVFHGELENGIISMPPRYGKTELVIHFIAWIMAHNPSSRNIYCSYNVDLAAQQTGTIKQIMMHPWYKRLFGVELKKNKRADSNFETTAGGKVFAAGVAGGITGREAGKAYELEEFSGVAVMDDLIKPDEALSNTVREATNNWFFSTMKSRLNRPSKSAFLFIGHQLHEDDPANMFEKKLGWPALKLPALDELGHALDPAKHTVEDLLELKRLSPFVFASQYQQNPIPVGNTLFNAEDFYLFKQSPNIITTFITVDTAESTKNHADYTVFSFWGIHYIRDDLYGLHWIDCHQTRIEPKDIENEFLSFYADCMLFKVQPKVVVIEKKSTGTTLVSILQNMQGLNIKGMNRTKQDGSKAQRYLEMQPYINKKLVSLPEYGRHTAMCIEHMAKITLSMSHRFDDISDTLFDAINMLYMEKQLNYFIPKNTHEQEDTLKSIYASHNHLQGIKNKSYKSFN